MNLFKNDSLGKLILRLAVGVLILLHGWHKVMQPESLGFIEGMLADAGLPAALAYGVYLGEVLGALMIILGLYTRLGALLVAVNMVFAIGLAHSHELTALTQHGGWALELQGLYLFGALALVFLGSGRIAIKAD